MPKLLNIYCDESSHLENDRQPVMGLGALTCPNNKVRDFARQIRDLKRQFGIADKQELKWVGVSPSNVEFYTAVVHLFFDSKELQFRVVLADKRGLDLDAYGLTHDDWYYRIYFHLLTRMLEQHNCYEVYLDLKDTLGARKIRKLHRVLSNAMLDFDQTAVRRVELIRSHESALLQLTDILTGAVCYVKREGTSSEAKRAIVDYIRKRSGFSLTKSTTLAEQKFNIFYWTGAQD